MKVSRTLHTLIAASLIFTAVQTAAVAKSNVSDNTGSNVSDNTGSNTSDNTGSNTSDNTGSNVADSARLNQLADDLGTAYESCQGGAGCSTFYDLYEQTLDILD